MDARSDNHCNQRSILFISLARLCSFGPVLYGQLADSKGEGLQIRLSPFQVSECVCVFFFI